MSGRQRAAGRSDRLLPADAGANDETVVFSSIEYPDKATRHAANEKMSADSEAMQMEMPFDGRRMFWGGFQPVLDE
jgi:uncharacterized protein YbaA (DUF1428 family)